MDLFKNKGITDFFLIADEVNLEKTSRGHIIVEVYEEFDPISLCYAVLEILHDKEEILIEPAKGVHRVRKVATDSKTSNTGSSVGELKLN